MTDQHVPAADLTGWLVPFLVVALPAGLYGWGIARRERPWSRWRTAALLTGTVVVAVALSPPVAANAHTDARGHMVQHLLLGMYAPLALVLSAPVTLFLGAAPGSARRRVAAALRSRPLHVLSHPVPAALLSTGSLFLLYLTPLYELSMERPAAHALLNLHFVAAGCLFAWTIAGPDPAPRRPGVLTRAVVLVGAMAAHAYLAKLLYARAEQLPLAAVHEVPQIEQAAQLMYYGGDGAEILLAVALFAGWYRARGRARRLV